MTINAAGTATAATQGTSADDPVLSPDGRYFSFVSDADDLVEDFTTDSTRDLFVRDLVTGVTTLVTAGLEGQGVGYDQGATRDAEFDPDSRFLVFTDNALLASPVTTAFNFNVGHNVYAFDVVARSQNLLTMNAAGTAPANGGFAGPFEGAEPFSFVVSPGGGSVYYVASFTDMVAGVTDTEHTYDLFESPLPPPAEPPGACGDPIVDGNIRVDVPALPHAVTASDALFILRAGVGLGTCENCVCDVDGSGSITATDALLTLTYAVGQPVELECPAC